MTEIWLIRHGQTDWNRAGRFQGHTDIPLNARGVEQAHELAQKLAHEHFAAVFSSDLSRARQTAEIVAAPLHLAVHPDLRLREIAQGNWEGLSLQEVQQKYAVDLRQADEAPETSRAPGGESVLEVATRMQQAADELARRYPHERVLLVSHGLAVSTLYCLANHIPLKFVHDHIPENATPLIVQWPPAQ
jgi:broad specificity phosphatase PhoE